MNLQGPNEVEFEVPTIPVAIFREFFTPMYIYQLQCLWVWFYVHYCEYSSTASSDLNRTLHCVGCLCQG